MPTRPAAQPKPPTAPPAPPEDPLADLREDPGAGLPPDPDQEPAPVSILLPDQEAQDELRRRLLVAWHADLTSTGFLHRGGGCGCNYLAGVALRAVAPVQATDPEDDDQGA